MSSGLDFLPISELAPQIRQRRVSCVEAVRSALERSQKLDRVLNSFITLLPEGAMEDARQMDTEIAHGQYRGPLHGIPISIKDHIDTAGIRTTGGAKSRMTHVPHKDAAVVRRMKQAGTVLIGKANMNRFASGESGENPDFGRIRNPWNTDFSPGGSSGGSGAQVAAGLVPLSIGSDNGGSVRIPAALCGIVGLKPTHGLISLEGIFPRLYSFDHPGPLTRTVEDCAIALQSLAGHDPGDTTTARKPVPDYSKDLHAGIKGLRIAFDRKYASVGQTEVLSAFDKTLDTLRALGASIAEVTIPAYDGFLAIGNTIGTCEFAVAAANLFREHRSDFDAGDAADIQSGSIIPAVDYIRATQQRRLLQREYARATRDVDVFVAPSYPLARRPFGAYLPVQGREFTFEDALRYTFPFDLLGVPAISVPCGFSDDGFPVGIQFITRAFDEATALRTAWAYEQATDWHMRRPTLAASS
jgi:aspartyl-tRNA(Asn)/glutamyl-tRNA(Gln) amidotransferase subunit A